MQTLAKFTIQKNLEDPNPVKRFPGVSLPKAAYPAHPQPRYMNVVTMTDIVEAFFIV